MFVDELVKIRERYQLRAQPDPACGTIGVQETHKQRPYECKFYIKQIGVQNARKDAADGGYPTSEGLRLRLAPWRM